VLNYVINNQIKLLTYEKPSNVFEKNYDFKNILNDFFLGGYYDCKIFIQDEFFLQIVILEMLMMKFFILQIAFVGIFLTNIVFISKL